MRSLIVAAVAAWSLIACAGANGAAGPDQGQFYGSLLGGYYEDPEDLNLSGSSGGFGGTVGFGATDRWLVEAMFLEFEPDVEVNGVSGDGELKYGSLNLLRKFGDLDRNWAPYLVGGGGYGKFDYDGLKDKDGEQIFTAGLGLFVDFTSRLSFRADIRGAYHSGAGSLAPMATAGLTYAFGAGSAAAAIGDADGDGVNDDVDACPGTAPGTPVDSTGCERDSDGDGVADGADACPGTPQGVAVDDRGCARDSDGDGVTDDRDECPDTPSGAQVDERGCERQIAQPVSFDLTVQFALDSEEITGVAFQEMLDLLRFLREYPSTTAQIEGHTDNLGDAGYNQSLSERRAQAVVTALVNSGIDRSRLTARGYGESQPIADNDTEAGRAQNRRVSVVVSGTAPEG